MARARSVALWRKWQGLPKAERQAWVAKAWLPAEPRVRSADGRWQKGVFEVSADTTLEQLAEEVAVHAKSLPPPKRQRTIRRLAVLS